MKRLIIPAVQTLIARVAQPRNTRAMQPRNVRVVPPRHAPDHQPPLHHREIERKFLVSELPAAVTVRPSAALRQGYLSHEPGRGQVRVREVCDERFAGPEWYLTVKRRKGMAREEVNLPLSRESFEQLWEFTVRRRLQKRRYYFSHRRLLIEVDVFGGVNAGLVLAEVEFRDEEEALRFVPPDWMSREVTRNAAYRNIALASE